MLVADFPPLEGAAATPAENCLSDGTFLLSIASAELFVFLLGCAVLGFGETSVFMFVVSLVVVSLVEEGGS